MSDMPVWVGPTVAISLLVIAASFLVMGAVVLALGLGIRRQVARARAQLQAVGDDAKAIVAKLKGEVEGFTELSGEAREKLKHGIRTVEGRLQDFDALVEVVQTEVEDSALDAAAFLRTVRRSGKILGAARAGLRRRR